MKALALTTVIAGVTLAVLLAFPAFLLILLSLDDERTLFSITAWLMRLAILSVPLLVGGVTFWAWRVYSHGEYQLTLKIGGFFVVAFLIVGWCYFWVL